MRVAIFDGILETHVGSSLKRAFIARGHDVFDTGKIGHGFKFPSPGSDTSHLSHAVGQVLDYRPDLVFVMRPASLPFNLLSELKRSGAALMAWFSDDPVLFDLTYGPVVGSYDFVLHCGNERVLQFYEEVFGRPTGVNFPFWTDHEAFPYVWGKEEPTHDVMFLGNVHDEVRRRRYFEMGKMSSSVALYGSVGADYFGISSGYLDSDTEVAVAGGRVRTALNIPQFFRDHRGLETWFPGLGDLGFFEYPSRVVQYMAMGLPTISVVPDDAAFRSFPEMMLASGISDADQLVQTKIRSGELSDLSLATKDRFDRHFSATSRVLAIEALLDNDKWRGLSAREREVWFTEFDASTSTASTLEESHPIEIARSVVTSSTEEAGEEPEVEEAGIAPEFFSSAVVVGLGWTRPASRLNAVRDSLGHLGLDVIDANPGSLSGDPSGVCSKAIDVSRLARYRKLPRGGLLVVCGVDASVTETGVRFLRESGVTSVLVDDAGKVDVPRGIHLATCFDLLATQTYELFLQLRRRGFSNVEFLPQFASPQFMAHLDSVAAVDKAIHVRQDEQSEEVACPAMIWDVDAVNTKVHSYDSLSSLSLGELATTLRSEVALLSPGGSRQNPRIHELAPYVAAASTWLFHPRNALPERVHPYEELAIGVQQVGELATKAKLLSSSQAYRRSYQARREPALKQITDGPELLREMLSRLAGGEAVDHQRLVSGSVRKVDLDRGDAQDAPAHVLEGRFVPLVGNYSDWWLSVRVQGKSVAGFTVRPHMKLLVTKPTNTSEIALEMVYQGSSANIAATEAVRAHVSVMPVSSTPTIAARKLGAIEMAD